MPSPGLRTRRTRAALWATGLTLGVLALMLGSASSWLMPGKLSVSHANITECSACHAGATDGKVGWLHQLVAGASPEQSAKVCLGCHVLGSRPFAPHTHPVEDLARITERLRAEPFASSPGGLAQRATFLHAPQSIASKSGQVYCATCHKEHQGTFHALSTISNERCQTCHVSKFGSFADSHPQFKGYPYARRTRIIFDHQSHLAKHFPDTATNAPQRAFARDCLDCHQSGVREKYMEVKTFEGMCASCHGGDILGTTRASGPKGVDFLAVPGLDLVTLAERGMDIGEWPGKAEAGISAFLRLLPAEGGKSVVDDVADLDLLDLSKATETQLKKVTAIAWAVKRIFAGLQTVNPAAMMPESGDLIASPEQRAKTVAMIAGLPHDVIVSGAREWFPNLQDDLQRHSKGEPTRAFKERVAPPAAELGPKAAAPLRAPSDPVILPPAASTPGKDDLLAPDNKRVAPPAAKSGPKAAAPAAPLRGPSDANILPPAAKSGPKAAVPAAPPRGPADATILPPPRGAPGKDVDLLAPGDKPGDASTLVPKGNGPAGGGLLAEKDQIILPAPPAGRQSPDALLGAPSDSGRAKDDSAKDILGGAAESPKPEVRPGATTSVTPKEFDPEDWAANGGWYRQDFTIRYRPTGHADRFLRAWLDTTAYAFGSDKQRMYAPIFGLLTASDAVGRCTKCHSSDSEGGWRNINWTPFDPARLKNRFTGFAHKPHIDAIGSKSCQTCHVLRSDADAYLKSYQAGDPGRHEPNFKYLEKGLCANCHSRQAAWENCTLCHNYHVNDITPEKSDASQRRQLR